jgi:hypothetical protein
MLQGMSWQQFLEWKAFDEIEPIGGARGDWQAASICSVVDSLRGRAIPLSPKDFKLRFDAPVRRAVEVIPPPAKDLKTIATLICKAYEKVGTEQANG